MDLQCRMLTKLLCTQVCCPYVICMKNSRGHNSFKNNSIATCWQYAQLGLVWIIVVKLYWILTKGCWEIMITKKCLRTDRPTARLLYSPHIPCIWGYNNSIRTKRHFISIRLTIDQVYWKSSKTWKKIYSKLEFQP